MSSLMSNNNANLAKLRAARLAQIKKENPLKNKKKNVFFMNINNNEPYFVINRTKNGLNNIILSQNSMIGLLGMKSPGKVVITGIPPNKKLKWWKGIAYAKKRFRRVPFLTNKSFSNKVYAWANVRVVRRKT